MSRADFYGLGGLALSTGNEYQTILAVFFLILFLYHIFRGT